jgi:hypothetical protein
MNKLIKITLKLSNNKRKNIKKKFQLYKINSKKKFNNSKFRMRIESKCCKMKKIINIISIFKRFHPLKKKNLNCKIKLNR